MKNTKLTLDANWASGNEQSDGMKRGRVSKMQVVHVTISMTLPICWSLQRLGSMMTREVDDGHGEGHIQSSKPASSDKAVCCWSGDWRDCMRMNEGTAAANG